jgi:hypothetical protein
VPLFDKGFLYVVDNLFWNLPFASVKQSISVREKFHIMLLRKNGLRNGSTLFQSTTRLVLASSLSMDGSRGSRNSSSVAQGKVGLLQRRSLIWAL